MVILSNEISDIEPKSDRKMFNIVADFKLNVKPNWLDDFRRKYDKPYQYHITLKTSTYFDENRFEDLKFSLNEILKLFNPIEITFNQVFTGQTSKGGCIMIKACKNNNLIALQRKISDKLSEYGEHITKEYKQYEKSFNPHITIARQLSPERFIQASSEIEENTQCKAIIEEVVLTVAKNDSFDEWSNSSNKTHFYLNKD